MSRHEDIDDSIEQSQLTFVKKALGNPADLTKHDFEDIRDSVREITVIAHDTFHLTYREIATQLVNLRTFAAFEGVDIEVPEHLSSHAFNLVKWKNAKGPKVGDLGEAGAHVSEAKIFGILDPEKIPGKKR